MTQQVRHWSYLSWENWNPCGDEKLLFCDKKGYSILHQVSTFILDKRVGQCALELQYTILSAKLSDDLFSQVAVYHNNPRDVNSTNDEVFFRIALGELISYMEENM